MVSSPGGCGRKGSVSLESVLWRRISIGAVVSSQLSAVSRLFGCQNKRRLYLRVKGKQTGRSKCAAHGYKNRKPTVYSERKGGFPSQLLPPPLYHSDALAWATARISSLSQSAKNSRICF